MASHASKSSLPFDIAQVLMYSVLIELICLLLCGCTITIVYPLKSQSHVQADTTDTHHQRDQLRYK